MSESAYWLYCKINKKIKVKKISEHCLEITQEDKKIIVYCPTTDEYEITMAVVSDAINENANIIAYPSTWCGATSSAISFGRDNQIEVMPFGKFFSDFNIST